MTGDELAKIAYENAGREITQSFEIQNSNMALVAGTLAAILTVLGAGELFARTHRAASTHLPHLSPTSLMVLSLAFPLIFRFFVRSLIAYQNLLRFNALQMAAWKYLDGKESEAAFKKHHEIYIEMWRSPKRFARIALENLRYGYFWVFTAASIALGWAFYCSPWRWGRVVCISILLVAAVWEVSTLRGTARKYFTVPTADELCDLRAARETGV